MKLIPHPISDRVQFIRHDETGMQLVVDGDVAVSIRGLDSSWQASVAFGRDFSELVKITQLNSGLPVMIEGQQVVE